MIKSLKAVESYVEAKEGYYRIWCVAFNGIADWDTS